jgi:hypothetical protein
MATPMKPVTGITEDTYNRLATDSGAVYADYGLPTQRLIGATRGGNQFVIEPEFREMVADGSPGPVKGSQRLIKSTAKLTINILEMTTENIKLALPGSISVQDVDGDKITRDCQIQAGDYLENITLVMAKNGTEVLFAFSLKNALCLNGLDWTAAEDDETVLSLEFTAHYDPNDLASEPWEIFNPEEIPTITHNLTYIAGANGFIIGPSSQTVNDGEDGYFVQASPDAGYQFGQWSDASVENPRQDTAVSDDITVTATFITL